MFDWLTGKIQLYAGILGAVVMAVAYAFLRGRKDGVNAQVARDASQTVKVQEKFQQIDNASVTVDAAFDSLRKRTEDHTK